MTTLQYDLHYLQAANEILQDYLLSSDVYWPVGIGAPRGAPPYPQLTLGNLLLAHKRAQARAITPAQRVELQQIEAQIDEVRGNWRVAWENKAAHEYRARLRLWSLYLDDYRKDPGLHAIRYSYEVGRRVMLQLLQAEARELPAEQVLLLEGMDKLVQAFFIEGEFVWEAELGQGFPQDVYWYLYGYLREELM
jgi:hypothetical protein